jgi:hypothetical protein
MRGIRYVMVAAFVFTVTVGGCDEPTSLEMEDGQRVVDSNSKRSAAAGDIGKLSDDAVFRQLARELYVGVGLPSAARVRAIPMIGRHQMYERVKADVARLEELEANRKNLSTTGWAESRRIQRRVEAMERKILSRNEVVKLQELTERLVSQFPQLTTMSYAEVATELHTAMQPEKVSRLGKGLAAVADTGASDGSGAGWCEAQYAAELFAASVVYYGALVLCGPLSPLCVPIAVGGHTAAVIAASINYGACKNGY